MAGIVRVFSRSSCLVRQTPSLITRRSTTATKKHTISPYEEMKRYWAKNRALGRPLSPHLSIYGYHTTMIASITNRVLAAALQTGLAIGSCIIMVTKADFTKIIDTIRSLNLHPAIINTTKYVLAFPFAYHLMVGLRHFVWDTGVAYSNKATIQGTYICIALGVILSTILVFGVKPAQQKK